MKIQLVCSNLRKTATHPNSSTNPNPIKYEGFALEDYIKLVDEIERQAEECLLSNV